METKAPAEFCNFVFLVDPHSALFNDTPRKSYTAFILTLEENLVHNVLICLYLYVAVLKEI
jgi:hypothetical protein